MVEPVRHRQTKEAGTDMFYLTLPRHTSTLPQSGGSEPRELPPLLLSKRTSIFPKTLEPLRRQLGVAHGVLNILVPEIVLHRARVLPIVRQLVAARMSQHVWMDRKRKLRALPCPRERL